MLYTYIPIHIKKPVLLVPMMDLLVLQHTSRKFTFHDTHVLTLCLPKGYLAIQSLSRSRFHFTANDMTRLDLAWIFKYKIFLTPFSPFISQSCYSRGYFAWMFARFVIIFERNGRGKKYSEFGRMWILSCTNIKCQLQITFEFKIRCF